jgi:glycosyltransferase involved in cell wall biosynthesis
MNCTLIYFHRIHFPSASGQTIQVLRDYHAMSQTQTVHLLYRSPSCRDGAQINDALANFGAQLTSSFHLHCIVDGWFGKYRAAKKVHTLIESSSEPIIIVTRVPDHTETAISIRDTFRLKPIKVIFELHETAIPHMVYRAQDRNVRAFLSYKKEKRLFHKVDGILCTAYPQLALLNEKFPNHAPATVLPNSYDEAFFQLPSKRRIKRKRDTFHMRYAGAFSEWKNIDVMIEALKFLPENVVLDIAGGRLGANDATEKMLMGQCHIHGVHKRMNYFGFLPPNQVPLFLTEADCLLLPLGNNVQSRFFTSPIKLFEYAASNVPMIITRQPTTVSLIQDGVHALMAEPDSPQDLARAVQYLMKNYDLGKKLAKSAKKWVTQYSANARAANYEEFIQQLIHKI